MFHLTRQLSAALVAFVFVACSGMSDLTGGEVDDGPSGEDDVPASAQIVASIADLPEATVDNTGYLYYVIDEERFYYSNGSEYIAIDLTGPPGTDGVDGTNGTDGSDGDQYFLVDSNDIVLGTLLDSTQIVTSTGHVVRIYPEGAHGGDLVHFSGTDGGGDAYGAATSYYSNTAVVDPESGLVYVLLDGVILQDVAYSSYVYYASSGYLNAGGTLPFAYALTSIGNDKSLIGLPDSIMPPLTIERRS